jgi:3-methyladenine DNA glycosylase AlkD
LWERRIAIISTLNFIKKENIEDTLEIAKLLLGDSHDLIHKAVGWMLREVGKKDVETLKYFLEENYDKIPRTTLRYAIERFEDGERKKLLKGKFKNGN